MKKEVLSIAILSLLAFVSCKKEVQNSPASSSLNSQKMVTMSGEAFDFEEFIRRAIVHPNPARLAKVKEEISKTDPTFNSNNVREIVTRVENSDLVTIGYYREDLPQPHQPSDPPYVTFTSRIYFGYILQKDGYFYYGTIIDIDGSDIIFIPCTTCIGRDPIWSGIDDMDSLALDSSTINSNLTFLEFMELLPKNS